jgi:hypothetical protein
LRKKNPNDSFEDLRKELEAKKRIVLRNYFFKEHLDNQVAKGLGLKPEKVRKLHGDFANEAMEIEARGIQFKSIQAMFVGILSVIFFAYYGLQGYISSLDDVGIFLMVTVIISGIIVGILSPIIKGIWEGLTDLLSKGPRKE